MRRKLSPRFREKPYEVTVPRTETGALGEKPKAYRVQISRGNSAKSLRNFGRRSAR